MANKKSPKTNTNAFGGSLENINNSLKKQKPKRLFGEFPIKKNW